MQAIIDSFKVDTMIVDGIPITDVSKMVVKAKILPRNIKFNVIRGGKMVNNMQAFHYGERGPIRIEYVIIEGEQKSPESTAKIYSDHQLVGIASSEIEGNIVYVDIDTTKYGKGIFSLELLLNFQPEVFMFKTKFIIM